MPSTGCAHDEAGYRDCPSSRVAIRCGAGCPGGTHGLDIEGAGQRTLARGAADHKPCCQLIGPARKAAGIGQQVALARIVPDNGDAGCIGRTVPVREPRAQ